MYVNNMLIFKEISYFYFTKYGLINYDVDKCNRFTILKILQRNYVKRLVISTGS